MPVVGIPTDVLRARIGADLSDEELDDLLDRLGCDVEGITTVRRLRCAACSAILERGEHEELLGACPECLTDAGDDRDAFWSDLGSAQVIRMELLPVRPDLFDAGGLARAIRGLLQVETGLADYELGESGYVVHVDPAMASEKSYRPHIGCAVVRGVKLDEESIRMMMKMQEDLHWALGRNRKFASIGIYDISALKNPFHYRPVGPAELSFVPLATTDGASMTPGEILRDHPKGKDYKKLLENHEAYPLLIDDAGQVLSMPPIINSHETALKLESTDLFIDVTGIEERPVAKTLNVVATSLAEIFPGSRIESVRIDEKSGSRVTPDLSPIPFHVSARETERVIGVPLDSAAVASHLRSMRFGAKESKKDGVTVAVPAYRNDILHEVDLIEDVAIAIGLANIPRTLIPSFTLASERPERVIARRVSTTLTGLGYTETMSLMLTNVQDLYERTRSIDPGDSVVTDNPASQEQSILRTRIAPGLLRFLGESRGTGNRRRIFEVDDVVRLEEGKEEPVQKLHIAAALQDRTAGFAEIKGVADAVAREIGFDIEYRPGKDPIFLEGRGAEIHVNGKLLGMVGEVHPEVLENFGINLPVAVLEIELY